MERYDIPTPEKRFNSPQEELDFLREKIKLHEKVLEARGDAPNPTAVTSRTLESYKTVSSDTVLSPRLELAKHEVSAITLKLSPETHDSTMGELAGLLQEKGIRNALSVVENLKDPHIADDFHRFLIEYIKEGHAAAGLKERTDISRSLHMTLFEIILPNHEEDGGQKTLKEIISSMEQLYAGLRSIPDPKNTGQNYFAIELAIPNVGEQFVFYAAIPIDKKELFEKQLLAIFPDARLTEKNDDYNIFNESGYSAASYAIATRNPIFPIKTYDKFDLDPLNVILNSLSKIDAQGEGAAIQLIISPEESEELVKKYKTALEDIRKGKSAKEAIKVPYTGVGEAFKIFKEVVTEIKKKEMGEKKDEEPLDVNIVEQINEKIAHPVFWTNIRLVASSRSKVEAEEILSNMESAFHQFDNTIGNGLKFERVTGSALTSFLKNYSFRVFSSSERIPLNTHELTTLMHLQTSEVKAPQLKHSKAGEAAAPPELPTDGVLIGTNDYRNAQTQIFIKAEDRMRHFYTIGQTGTGKSTLLKNMVIQDIERGDGVCMIDPHGVDVLDVLSRIPKERAQDVIYFDPSYTERPMALNMLEYDQKYPEQKTFVVNELFNIFQKLYGAVPESMGPMFEQYFRNAAMLAIEDPESGSTLLDVSRVLSDKAYRTLKLSKCKNPVVAQFWREIAEKAGGEGALANIVPYITSKFDIFLANDIMRPIVAQEHSVFDFRKIMDERKILLVNLAKGRLGDINANLLGLILVGKILMATLSRVDALGGNIPDFYLYIDEFQNITTTSISTILSEARKYRLGLTVAHQFIAQLEDNIRDAVFGNVGSIAAFRVGSDDAEYLEKQFAPTFGAQDLMNIDNRNAYLKLLVNGRPVTPFNVAIPAFQKGDPALAEWLKQASYDHYGAVREDVEKEINAKYNKTSETHL
jgi:hypothetical protein